MRGSMKVLLLALLVVYVSAQSEELQWARTQCGFTNQVSQWGSTVDPNNVLPEYPRPQLVRPDYSWKNLNGLWQFQPGNANDQPPFGKTLSGSILVPFPVEACLSGVGKNYQYLWYRLVFNKPTSFNNSNVILRFGAVDWQTTVWVNTHQVGQHTGGYDGFSFDITNNLTNSNNELLVFVYDPSDNGAQPNGKQRISAINSPGGDTYTPSSGIWQTVWLENVPSTYISGIKLTPSMSSITITTTLAPGTQPIAGVDYINGDIPPFPIVLNDADMTECADKCAGTSGCVGWSYGPPGCDGVQTPRCWLKSSITSKGYNPCRTFAIVGPAQPVKYTVLDGNTVVATGAGSANSPVTINIPSPKLWSSTSPFLYNLIITTTQETVTSYFGLRSVSLGTYQHPAVPPTGPQQNIDRAGGDMPNMPITLSSANPDLCWARCNQTAGCVAWAYGVPNCGGGSNSPLCWLKNSVTGTGDNNCRVSGAQGQAAYTARRPLINNQYTFLAGWLDQSFWPDGQYTAPSDAALMYDLQMVKTFGMNVVRLHQKVNSERWYYHADKLGIIILQDMIQKYGGATAATIPYFIQDIQNMMIYRYNQPCIIQWTVFNEGDCVGQFNAPQTVDIAQRLDPTRLVDTNSGGPANDLHIADVNDIHTYPYPGDPLPSATQYGMIGEFGGVGAFVPSKEWKANSCGTYLRVDTPAEEATTYITMAKQIQAKKNDISVSIYTQITDVELECDGFLNYDRTNKFDGPTTQSIAAANQALIGETVQF